MCLLLQIKIAKGKFMSGTYDLTQLDAQSFEHLVNFLALKVLGNGVTSFSPGADGGKDGYLKGRAPYPTEVDCWEGIWFLQSKFHKPHLSKDSQKWLVNEVRKEIKQFENSNRHLKPNIWIIATNIDPTGIPQTGSFDTIKAMVRKFDPEIKVDIWGGRKILDLLAHHNEAAIHYGHFLTPGHVITKLYEKLNEYNNQVKDIIDHLILNQFQELSYTKLEQAGSGSDQRPKIYELFRDLPVTTQSGDCYFIMESLVSAAKNVQKNTIWNKFGHGWQEWSKNPTRARVLLLKGGPGQGKSTAGQYFGQLQRAAFILSENGPGVPPQHRIIAEELMNQAKQEGFWPSVPRIPVFVELKDFANWYSLKKENEPKNIVAYLCDKIKSKTAKNISAEMLHDAFKLSTWFINFDGLDEVPNDLKDHVAYEIISFTNELIPHLDADFLILCTTRPQGYSGQFENLFSATVTLSPLPAEIALQCATSVVQFNRSSEEAEEAISILKYAMASEQVRELMTTPLQSHIMAVVVRDGGRPPEKRWELFKNFYTVMKKRESQKNFPDIRISALLRDRDQLLKSIHDRLGICLHTKSENSKGAEATFEKAEFYQLAKQTSAMQIEGDVEDIVDTLMEATTERLVFVNTPESSESVRFDIRQLQEFFAAEFIYSAVDSVELRRRLEIICGDAHWREVVHFLLSALAHNKILSELSIAVTIIQQLDDDGESHRIKTFKKRMGIGSLLTLRLIEEGVLEQDKRIRYQFNNSLTPLWNNLDKELINRLVSVKKEQSRTWLINNLVEAFINLDYSETISAGYLIAIMLPPDHPRIEEVKRRLSQAPEYYFHTTLELDTWSTFEHRGRINKDITSCQLWFIELFAQMITKPTHLSSKTQLAIVRFVVRHLDEINQRGVISLPEEVVQMLDFINAESKRERRPSKTKQNQEDQYCFLSVAHHNKNWKAKKGRRTIPNIKITDNELCKPLNLLKSAYIYYRENTIENYLNFLQSIKENGYNVDVIPSRLKAMIPLNVDYNNLKKHISAIEKLDKDGLNAIITEGFHDGIKVLPALDFIRFTDSPFTKEGWSRFCNDYPGVALNIWCGPFIEFGVMEAIKKNQPLDFYDPLLKIALHETDLFAAYIGYWTELFLIYPEHEKEIREKLCLSSPDSNRLVVSDFDDEKSLLKINPQTEKKLIVIFANSLIKGRVQNYITHHSGYRPLNDNYNEKVLSKMGIPNDFLINTFTNPEESSDIRAACLGCYISQHFTEKNHIINDFFKNKHDELFLSLLTEETTDLLINALYIFLYDIPTYDYIHMEFIGDASLITKESYSARLILQNIYQRWRERSFAPVQRNEVLESWLEYSY